MMMMVARMPFTFAQTFTLDQAHSPGVTVPLYWGNLQTHEASDPSILQETVCSLRGWFSPSA